MSRRGKGEGGIRQRPDGRWEATITLPPEGGRRRRKYYFARTRAEVAKKLTAALRATDTGESLPSERLRVGVFLREWLGRQEVRLRPESYRRYREACDLHLIPEIGQRALSHLSAFQVENAYTRLRAKGLSGTTLSLIHGVLHVALADALRKGAVVRNVADAVDAPKRTTGPMATLDTDEARKLLTAAQGDPLEAFYVTALTCGLRLGELQAVKWKAIDLDRRSLRVEATYQGNAAGEPLFGEPKTAGSRRTVHLSALAVSALRAHRTAQIEQRLRAGPVWRDYGLVFTGAYGLPLDGNNLRTRSFARLLTRAGLGPMRFHTLRHAAATLLMAEGVSVKAIGEMLGHTDVQTTLRIYAHVLPSAHEQAANAMNRLFGVAVAVGGQIGGQTPPAKPESLTGGASSGGDGGELNSPSRERWTRTSTGVVLGLFSPAPPREHGGRPGQSQ